MRAACRSSCSVGSRTSSRRFRTASDGWLRSWASRQRSRLGSPPGGRHTQRRHDPGSFGAPIQQTGGSPQGTCCGDDLAGQGLKIDRSSSRKRIEERVAAGWSAAHVAEQLRVSRSDGVSASAPFVFWRTKDGPRPWASAGWPYRGRHGGAHTVANRRPRQRVRPRPMGATVVRTSAVAQRSGDPRLDPCRASRLRDGGSHQA